LGHSVDIACVIIVVGAERISGVSASRHLSTPESHAAAKLRRI